MAFNVITASNSRTTLLVDHESSATLVVTANGYIATADYGYYADGGGASVAIAGSVFSAIGAIYLTSMASGFSGFNVVTVSSTGLVSGFSGIFADGGNNNINNNGTITSSSSRGYGVYVNGADNVINNDGSISGAFGIYSLGSGVIINNHGHITGTSYGLLLNDSGSINNDGTIDGYIYSAATLHIVNNGIINGVINVSQESDSDGSSLINHGTISNIFQTSSFGLPATADSVTNDGVMADINLQLGNDVVSNFAGGLITGPVTLGLTSGNAEDNDTLTNGGTISANVIAGIGDDAIDTSTGVITGVVDLGAGNDTYTGGEGADRVVGGTGNDAIDLGAGNDMYYAGNADGKDEIDGGDGVDTYNALSATLAVTIDLAAGTTANTGGGDILTGFENIIGGQAADNLTGSDGANRINASPGNDIIDGGAGSDRLIGGLGVDTIAGGAGRDIMTGGAATGNNSSDKFLFGDSDSGTTAATRDAITDFSDHGSATGPYATGADLINLSAIDANTTAVGDQAFSFNTTAGAAFSGAAGSLIWQQYGAFALVSGDTDGDGKADFALQLNGTHTLFASDFAL